MIGIDIGSRTIKIVELIKEGKKFRLKSSGVIGHNSVTPEHAKDDREIGTIADALRKLAGEARVSSRNVVLALPEPQVFTRTIRFPLLTDQEIASAVKWEAEQYIPIAVNEAVVQHEILERKENSTPQEVVVLLVAAPKEMVEKYIRTAQMAKLTVMAVETGMMAMVRALAPADKTVLLVDFGASSTDIAIARNRHLVFTRSIPTAGEAFTRAIAQSLGIQSQQAEEYKRTYGLSSAQLEGRVRAALEPVFKMVADEIKKAIHFYQAEEKGESPQMVILAGGTAGMPEAVSALTRYVGLEVIIGNPFENVTLDPNIVKDVQTYAPLYSVAAGLAMREE